MKECVDVDIIVDREIRCLLGKVVEASLRDFFNATHVRADDT